MSDRPVSAEQIVWHLPDDRLPPYNAPVLVTARWGEVSKPDVILVYRKSTDHKGEHYCYWGNDRELEQTWNVIAWAAMPRPYHG